MTIEAEYGRAQFWRGCRIEPPPAESVKSLVVYLACLNSTFAHSHQDT